MTGHLTFTLGIIRFSCFLIRVPSKLPLHSNEISRNYAIWTSGCRRRYTEESWCDATGFQNSIIRASLTLLHSPAPDVGQSIRCGHASFSRIHTPHDRSNKVMVSCSPQKESPLTRAISQWGWRKELLTSFRPETR